MGGEQVNPNRTWPGREDGNAVERHSWLITHKLILGNVDIGIDHHTGGPRGFVPEMVEMGVDGNHNVLVRYGVLPDPKRQTAADRNVFVGNDLESARVVAGGFVTLLVELNDTVTKGQFDYDGIVP